MINNINQKSLFIDFDSTFIKVETIDELAKLSLQNDPNSDKKINLISDITNKAMSGDISFSKALEQRLEILSLNQNDIISITENISNLISDSFLINKKIIQSISDSIWILSGGFKEIIIPIVEQFGISSNHVLANSFIYDKNQIVGCDKDNNLFKDKGKIKAINNLNIKNDIIMIGDGFTDYEVYRDGPAKIFICYTENISRKSITEVADYKANNFNEIINILNQC
ncbi:MAG: hypothetical protein CMG25_02900 [Candidatus Marinimicrobia bacterium]|nr:hypothetical protein [Candidatus Neomarinimicrobiota bacterium]